jgi:ABC-type transport system involved in multi-copper enzyme maturation permease subunit
VSKRTYTPYTGALTGRRTRFAVLMRYAFADVWASRVTVVLSILCFVPSLISLGSLYVLNNEVVRTLLNSGRATAPIAVDEIFFNGVLQVQCWCALVLTAWVGPRLIASDLSNNALPIILSHPVSRMDYVLAKFVVLAGFLSAVTWAPALFLFTFQSYMSARAWAGTHLFIAFGMLVGAVVWIALLTLLALAASVWVKWRIVATGLVFGAIFVPAGLAEVFNSVMRTDWGNIISIPFMMETLWRRLLHLNSSSDHVHEIPSLAILISLCLICVACVAALNSRIRAREVVRG